MLEYNELFLVTYQRIATAALQRLWQIEKTTQMQLLDKKCILDLLMTKIVEQLFDMHEAAIDLTCTKLLVVTLLHKNLCEECKQCTVALR